MIKAIETKYNGYRFRSRTEARWAVTFDAAGIRYEYEKEGYNLPGGRYLPDFWLPTREEWFEVKGGEPEQGYWKKAFELVTYGRKPLVVVFGAPDPARLDANVCLPSGIMATVEFLRISDEALLAGKRARFEHGELGV